MCVCVIQIISLYTFELLLFLIEKSVNCSGLYMPTTDKPVATAANYHFFKYRKDLMLARCRTA